MKLNFDTVLDAFGRIAVISYALKKENKTVSYNDPDKHNYYVGKAIIENKDVKLLDSNKVVSWNDSYPYKDYISTIYKDIFFQDEDNAWLDVVVQNINNISNEYEKSIAFYAVGQSCIRKRPFGGFHRANASLLNKDLHTPFYRSALKKDWHFDFVELFNLYVNQANSMVFNNGKSNVAMCSNPLDIKGRFDLVFIDPIVFPYYNSGPYDIRRRYSFLEGLVNYENIPSSIDTSAVKAYHMTPNPWLTRDLGNAYDKLFLYFKDSILAILIDEDALMSWSEINDILFKYKRHIRVFKSPIFNSAKRKCSYLIIGQ
jgi:adenine-specific DNA methylase